MIVLAQQTSQADSIGRSFALSAQTAREQDLLVINLPENLTDYAAEDLLGYHDLSNRGPAVFSWGWHGQEIYQQFEDALAARGTKVWQTASQAALVMNFEQFYPHIADLTAQSYIIKQEEDLQQLVGQQFPLFIKGAVKSAKEQGWEACTVGSFEQLAARYRHWGAQTLIGRQILPLRQGGQQISSFPVSREYRLYVVNGQIISCQYYWHGPDDFGPLTAVDEKAVKQLAFDIYERLAAPLLCVDVGQLEDGSWVCIEVGDIQCTGLMHISRPYYWQILTKVAGS